MELKAIWAALGVIVFLISGLSVAAGQTITAVECHSIGYWKNEWKDHQEEFGKMWEENFAICFGKVVTGAPWDPEGFSVSPTEKKPLDSTMARLMLDYRCPYWGFKAAFNGYVKLGGQYVAAVLNIAHGAEGTMIQDVLNDVEQEFSTMNCAVDYGGLSKEKKQYILDLMNELEAFNCGNL